VFLFALENRNAIGPLARARENGANAMKTVLAVAAGLLVLLLAEAAAQAADIVVMSSTGLQAALEALAPKLEKATGDKLAMTIGPGNDLKDKIEGGATFDVTILTPALIDMLIHDGKVVPGSAANIARAGVGVAYKAGGKRPDISTLAALKQTLLEVKSITYATAGQSGTYFIKLIDQMGITDQVKAKSKTLPGGHGVGELVATGQVELAVQSVPDLMAAQGVEVVPFPKDLQNYTVLTGGVAASSKNPQAAMAFLKYLTAPEAVPVLKAKGLALD
jgi:molybdate transport system substrate-binding protein